MRKMATNYVGFDPNLFRNYDKKKRGLIAAKDLHHILAKWGEKLSAREGESRPQCEFHFPPVCNTYVFYQSFAFAVDQIFREAGIQPNGTVRYEEFVKIVCAPVPDYY